MPLAIDLEQIAVVVANKIGTQAEKDTPRVAAQKLDIDGERQIAVGIADFAAALEVGKAGWLGNMITVWRNCTGCSGPNWRLPSRRYLR